MPTIVAELLTVAGMASARTALTAKYEWFLHVKPVSQFNHVKEKGLEPRNQGCTAEPEVLAARGAGGSNIVCLRPIGTFDTTPRRGNTMYMMALHRDDLPTTVGLDFSYSGTWTLPAIIKNDCPTATNDDIFCEVVRRRGSVITYEPIPKEALRVWTTGKPQNDPSQWPRLVDVERGDIKEFN